VRSNWVESLTFKVSHEGCRSRVEGVDDHFPVHWTGDFDPPVLEALHRRRPLPALVVAHVGSLGQEVGQSTSIKLGLEEYTTVKQVLAGWVKVAVKLGQERERVGSQDRSVRALDLACVITVKGLVQFDRDVVAR